MREPERALGTAAWGIAGLDSALWPAGWPVSLLPRELQSLPGSPLQHELTAPGAFRGPTTRASSLSALPGTLDAAFPSAARFFLGKRLSPSLHFSSKPQTGGGGTRPRPEPCVFLRGPRSPSARRRAGRCWLPARPRRVEPPAALGLFAGHPEPRCPRHRSRAAIS